MRSQLRDQLRRRASPAAPLTSKGNSTQLRVMTYNTHHGANRRGVVDIEAIARTIESVRPDLVALQEVDRHWGERSGRLDQPSWYAARLGMAVQYAPIIVRDDDEQAEPAEYGLAILSRLVLTEPTHRLFTGGHAEPRGLMGALVTVQTASGPRVVRLINTHLSVRDRRLRAAEIAQLQSYAESELDLPTVVAGDFNALTRARALRAMRIHYRDAWEAGLGSPATVPGRRIDYLWVSRHLRPVQTVVIPSRASDHFAVVSDLDWV